MKNAFQMQQCGSTIIPTEKILKNKLMSHCSFFQKQTRTTKLGYPTL